MYRKQRRRLAPYCYYDVTPNGENNEFNCVTRAITKATGLPYYEIRELLVKNAKINDCDELCVSCYDNLLEDYFGYERHDCNFRFTVQEVADMYAENVVLIRVNGHLTVAVKSTIYDIFDCTNKKVDCFWVV